MERGERQTVRQTGGGGVGGRQTDGEEVRRQIGGEGRETDRGRRSGRETD